MLRNSLRSAFDTRGLTIFDLESLWEAVMSHSFSRPVWCTVSTYLSVAFKLWKPSCYQVGTKSWISPKDKTLRRTTKCHELIKLCENQCLISSHHTSIYPICVHANPTHFIQLFSSALRYPRRHAAVAIGHTQSNTLKDACRAL